MSEALKAVASALSLIKDIHITQIKRDSAKDLKIMDLESRRQLKDVDNTARLMMSRDEIFKKIMEEAKVIEAQAETVTINLSPALSAK